MTMTIDLCANWDRIGEAPAATLEAVVRDLALGEWQLEGATAALEMGSGRTVRDVDTVRVVDGNRIVFAGYVAPVDAGGLGGLTISSDANGERFQLVGPDVWAALASRFAYPSPDSEPPWADAHDERSGLASTVAIAYIDANLGGSALADRRFPAVTLLDGESGAMGTWSARLQRLDEWVARVCHEGGITCRPSIDFEGRLVVYCGAPRDRSARIVLADQGDLTDIQTVVAPAAATYVVVGGQGDLTARTFAATGGGTGVARRELFVDQTGIPSSDELAQSAVTTLSFAGESTNVLAQLSDAAAQHLAFGIDYEIGDTIAAQVDGIRYPTKITSVGISLTPDRQVVRPAFGNIAVDPLARLIKALAELESVNRSNIA